MDANFVSHRWKIATWDSVFSIFISGFPFRFSCTLNLVLAPNLARMSSTLLRGRVTTTEHRPPWWCHTVPMCWITRVNHGAYTNMEDPLVKGLCMDCQLNPRVANLLLVSRGHCVVWFDLLLPLRATQTKRLIDVFWIFVVSLWFHGGELDCEEPQRLWFAPVKVKGPLSFQPTNHRRSLLS